jgi:cyclophilin family peptidyl-prolyl cis-trans isomerase
VEITTTKGKIVLELFENEAPNTVANFISLVEQKFYNGSPFHRVLPVFMAQGGTRNGDGPGYTIDDECGRRFPDARKHFRGSISMANIPNRPGSNSSQFFLTFVPTAGLDGGHTVFGRVVEGIDVLANIQRYDPSDEKATIPELDKIISAKVLNKRDHAYTVKKNAGR